MLFETVECRNTWKSSTKRSIKYYKTCLNHQNTCNFKINSVFANNWTRKQPKIKSLANLFYMPCFHSKVFLNWIRPRQAFIIVCFTIMSSFPNRYTMFSYSISSACTLNSLRRADRAIRRRSTTRGVSSEVETKLKSKLDSTFSKVSTLPLTTVVVLLFPCI